MTRTGVFLCACDGAIGRSIDLDAVPGEVQADETWVTLAAHVCLPAGIRDLQAAIARERLDRVVVAACPARFQENRLRAACASAGIPANYFTLVDWREGCALPHPADRENATVKAIDLVRMGIARVENAEPVQPAISPIIPAVLVVGGGMAGMTAARALAERGIAVTLVERNPRLGGASADGAGDIVAATVESVLRDPYIDAHLDSQIIAVDGAVGNQRVTLRHGTTGSETQVRAGAVVVATGTQEYRPTGLYRHDAYRVLTLQEFENQTKTSEVLRSTPAAQQSGAETSEVCADSHIVYILCAGSRDRNLPYCSRTCCLDALHQALRVKRARPDTRITILFRDLYLLGDEMNDAVVREARQAGIAFARYSPAHPPQIKDDAVIVQDELSGRALTLPYDRVVLATAQVPREDAGVLAHLLDIPRDENGFFVDPHWRLRPERTRERGIFVCGSAHRPVDADTAILQGLTTAARAARFVAAGVLHHPGWSAAVQPALCTGCAQCVETCAFRAIRMVHPAGTPAISEGSIDHAVIDPFLCQACGNCVVACPSRAIRLPTASDAQIFAQLDAALADPYGHPAPDGHPELDCHPERSEGSRSLNGHPESDSQASPRSEYRSPNGHHSPAARTIVFACAWSGFAAMELAGARRLRYPASTRVIELPCSARLDPLHVLYAFFSGAARVVVALCPPDECHFGSGNRSAQTRLDTLREELAAHGIDPHRLLLAPLLGDNSGQWIVVSG